MVSSSTGIVAYKLPNRGTLAQEDFETRKFSGLVNVSLVVADLWKDALNDFLDVVGYRGQRPTLSKHVDSE